MPNRNFPLLRWTDPSGNHTAVLAGCFDATAAHAPSIKEAMQQLKDILLWRLENEPWMADPDLLEPALLEVKVEIQPQYSGEDRIIPCPETLWIRMPCVTGVQENGLRVCAVPMLDIRFNYHDEGGLKSLAAHYIKDAIQGLSPLELAGRLPPRDCVLDEISLPDEGRRIRRKLPADRPELKALFSVADPLLHAAGRKRTAPAAHGREALSCALARILEQETASVLLVGASGVGKSTLIFDAVKKMSRNKKRAGDGDGDDDAGMDSYRYWRGNAGRMIAGMQYLGEWEERCEAFIEQLNAIDGVFCAESLLDLVRVGGQGPGDGVAAFLLLYLQRGELRMIAEATPGEVEACRRLMPGLLDMFQVLPVPDFSDAEAVEVLSRIAGSHATASRREIEPAVAPLVHRLFKRFLPDAAFPGSAANFVRSLCERTAGHKSVQKGAITVQDAMALFIKQTGLPELFLRDEMPLEMEQVRRTFDALIVGQADATLAAARLTAKIKSGLTDPGRPFGVLLFCGPTGVGKTALAKALAEFCFGADGAKDRLIRLDMSEYGGWGAAGRFLRGANGRPAAWIEKIRAQPFCVLLLDEIEKAASEVFDVLLGILDEGRLADPFGRVASFRGAIVVVTSNLGSSATSKAGFKPDSSPAYASEVAKFFRPEFFNRLDAVIAFKPLGPIDVALIARKELNELAAREGLASSSIRLEFSEDLVGKIAREGYDHRFGARPLQRAIERMVVTPLARWKVENPLKRDAILTLDLAPNGNEVLVLTGIAPATP